MKSTRQRIIDFLPYCLLMIVVASVVILIWWQDLSFSQYLELAKVLSWPAITLLAFLFFRKVFTYLFFSMEEFSFFGAKGELKGIQEVIEERVQRVLTERDAEQKRIQESSQIAADLEVATKSMKDADARAEDNLGLARRIYEDWKTLSEKNEETTKELEGLRREKADREAHIVAMRERIRRRRVEEAARRAHDESEPTAEQLDAAGDAWVAMEVDRMRGK